MKVISIINLKGGVGKTVSAINIAHILATVHSARVLLIDNDKQGNTSKFFGVHSYEVPSIADVLSGAMLPIQAVIRPTAYERLSVAPANMNLLRTNSALLIDTSRLRDFRLRNALQEVESQFDYCVVDSAPDINISVINALMATDDVLIPVKIDRFAFDGLKELLDQIQDVQEGNQKLTFTRCFFTMFQKNNVNRQGDEWLRNRNEYSVLKTQIRSTVKVTEMTYAGRPLLDYSKNCTAAKDYVSLVSEYLEMRC